MAKIRWGERAPGPKDALSRAYLSAFVDDQEIRLHDFVYLASAAEKPFVGLVTRLYENRINFKKNVDVRWLYRPADLDIKYNAGEKELFLALGSGAGAEDVNSLEVIEGKCNCKVFYPPKDLPEWQPTAAQVEGVEYYVCRCYDHEDEEVHSNLENALMRIGGCLSLVKNSHVLGFAVKSGPAKTGASSTGKIATKLNTGGPSAANVSRKLKLEVPAADKITAKPISAGEVPATTKMLPPGRVASQRNLFRKMSWEDTLGEGYEKGKVILLRNFDPTCTSKELKEALLSVFPDMNLEPQLEVSAIPRISTTPGIKTGEAVVVFKKKDTGERLLEMLNQNCLILTENEGPVIASPVQRPPSNGRMFGHLPIEKYWRVQKNKFKEAVSTAHCAQPNTIEFEMALQWRLLDKQHRFQNEKLAQMHAAELAHLRETCSK